MNIKFTAAALAAALLATAAPGFAVQHYKISDLGILPGGSSSAARAISENGQIGGEANLSFVGTANTPTQFNSGATALPNLVGANDTYVRGINDSGVSAAVVQTTGGNDRAALLSMSDAIELAGISGFNAAGAFDINNAGVAVGYVLSNGRTAASGSAPIVTNGARSQKAVVWQDGIPTLLAAPVGAVNSMAFSINDDGIVAGMYRTANNQIHGVVWTNGVPTTLTVPAGQSSVLVRAISDAGWVAGQSSGEFGTVWTPSGAILLPQVLSGAIVTAVTRGINSAGTVVGFSGAFDANDNVLASASVLWDYSNGSYVGYDLASLVVNLGTWDLGFGSAQAINDRGDIVGFGGIVANGLQHAYLLTAVPEPASWAMMIGGFGMIGGALRCRRVAVA